MKNHKILCLNNVEKSFGSLKVLRGVSLELNQGECLGVLGGSGCGKSVLLRTLIGLEMVDRGEIIFNQRRIDHFKEKDWIPIRQKMAFIFQSGALFDSESVFENVAFPLWEHTKLDLKEIEKRVEDILLWVGLRGQSHLMPSELSGGMLKRVSMARALILRPELMLFDEPTSGLDPQNTQNITNIMKNLKGQGMSSVVVTHDVTLAASVCDSIILLEDGIVVFRGVPSEVLAKRENMVRRYFGLNNSAQRGENEEGI